MMTLDRVLIKPIVIITPHLGTAGMVEHVTVGKS